MHACAPPAGVPSSPHLRCHQCCRHSGGGLHIMLMPPPAGRPAGLMPSWPPWRPAGGDTSMILKAGIAFRERSEHAPTCVRTLRASGGLSLLLHMGPSAAHGVLHCTVLHSGRQCGAQKQRWPLRNRATAAAAMPPYHTCQVQVCTTIMITKPIATSYCLHSALYLQHATARPACLRAHPNCSILGRHSSYIAACHRAVVHAAAQHTLCRYCQFD